MEDFNTAAIGKFLLHRPEALAVPSMHHAPCNCTV